MLACVISLQSRTAPVKTIESTNNFFFLKKEMVGCFAFPTTLKFDNNAQYIPPRCLVLPSHTSPILSLSQFERLHSSLPHQVRAKKV
jgi:hypothetical protein